jgi:hypothetical protein
MTPPFKSLGLLVAKAQSVRIGGVVSCRRMSSVCNDSSAVASLGWHDLV